MFETTDARRAVARAYRLAIAAASLPIVLADYFDPDTGAAYDVGLVSKLILAARMVRNNWQIPTGSSFVEHLVMAAAILEVPRTSTAASSSVVASRAVAPPICRS